MIFLFSFNEISVVALLLYYLRDEEFFKGNNLLGLRGKREESSC